MVVIPITTHEPEPAMRDLMTLLPIFAFMLIPVWIPMIAMIVGALRDAAFGRTTPTVRPAARRVSPAGPQVLVAGTAR